MKVESVRFTCKIDFKYCVKTINIVAATLLLPILKATISAVFEHVRQTWQVLTSPA